jgi:hypothetical protein
MHTYIYIYIYIYRPYTLPAPYTLNTELPTLNTDPHPHLRTLTQLSEGASAAAAEQAGEAKQAGLEKTEREVERLKTDLSGAWREASDATLQTAKVLQEGLENMEGLDAAERRCEEVVEQLAVSPSLSFARSRSLARTFSRSVLRSLSF